MGTASLNCPACARPATGNVCACGSALQAGPFRVTAVLARNAHSSVYRAEGTDGRAVALKELAFAFAPDARTIDAFHREAALLRDLRVAGVPRFVDAFEQGIGAGLRLYLAQELIEGAPLNQLLEGGPLPEAEVLRIGRSVLHILQALHSHQPPIFHRDLKPANLIRQPNGEIVLVDFGVARESRAGGTHGATLVGTFGYMPPEQLGGSVDETSDLYALGATLLHLATGKPPDSFLNTSGQILEIDLARAAVAPTLGVFLTRLLAAKRKERFASAAEALASLDATPAREEPLQRLNLAAAGVFGLAVFALIGMAVLRPSPLQPPAPTPTPVVQAAPPPPKLEAPPLEEPSQKLSGPLPTLAIDIQEGSSVGAVESISVAETGIISELIKSGFTFVAPGPRPRKMPSKSGPDFLITGTAVTRDQGNINDLLGGDKQGVGMISCKGLITLRMFRTQNATIVASIDASKAALHVDSIVCQHNALEQAARLAAAELQKKILENWTPQAAVAKVSANQGG